MKVPPGTPGPHALEEVATLATDVIIIVSLAQGLITFANPAAIKTFKLKSGDPLSKINLLIESVNDEDREYVKTRYRAAGQQSTTTNLEFRLLQGSGETTWFSASTYLFDEDRFVLAVVRDITGDRRHEDYLVEFGARKNTLLDTVAHQLNGAMMLMNNLALRAGKSNVTTDQEALDRFVSLVLDNSQHCIKIIHDLITEEHGESPGVTVRFSRVDIVKIVTYIFDELKKTQAARKIVLDTEAVMLVIDTDDFKFLQVINNLASNSMKFTREGGEIRFIVRETETSVLVAVADDGIGIPEELQPFIFERHGPARRTGLNGEKSLGLGLSICKHLTGLLHGKIWVESEPGKGTTMFVELPKKLS